MVKYRLSSDTVTQNRTSVVLSLQISGVDTAANMLISTVPVLLPQPAELRSL